MANQVKAPNIHEDGEWVFHCVAMRRAPIEKSIEGRGRSKSTNKAKDESRKAVLDFINKNFPPTPLKKLEKAP